ncbi:hypothetical protein [Mangrovicoccus sp. HB161399]|uniref:hypothetical protein n=1 Tax=Mangrovicoccus sp. HB161399 TaxID=2720392 RepID=UPI0015559FD8|nr:hypothetical protein [Mangrovicoccus sp. HB161399]
MSDGKFIADTLESVIVGMAESLREAQEELAAAAPLDAFGRPMPQYHIPHLDFEIGFRLVTESKSDGGMRLIFAPVTSSESSSEVTSTISGRFVAVPPGEGLPLPVLAAEVSGSGNARTLTVAAANTAGEILVGAEVQVNVDLEASRALSLAAGASAPKIDGQVTLGEAVLVTGPDGQASTSVTFSAALQRAAIIVLTVETGAETVRVTTGKDIA